MKNFFKKIFKKDIRLIENPEIINNIGELKDRINKIEIFDNTPIIFRTPNCDGYYKAYAHLARYADTKDPVIIFDLCE